MPIDHLLAASVTDPPNGVNACTNGVRRGDAEWIYSAPSRNGLKSRREAPLHRVCAQPIGPAWRSPCQPLWGLLLQPSAWLWRAYSDLAAVFTWMPARQRVSPHERTWQSVVADGLTYAVPVFIRSARVFAMASAWVVGEPGMCSVVNLLLFATEGLAYNHPLRTGPHNARE